MRIAKCPKVSACSSLSASLSREFVCSFDVLGPCPSCQASTSLEDSLYIYIYIHIYGTHPPSKTSLQTCLYTCMLQHVSAEHTRTHTHTHARTHTHTGRFCIYSSSAGSGHNQNEGSAHVLANRQESRQFGIFVAGGLLMRTQYWENCNLFVLFRGQWKSLSWKWSLHTRTGQLQYHYAAVPDKVVCLPLCVRVRFHASERLLTYDT